jgi:UDPglucose--hexose-1-phosphate uridylyltransferase
MSGGELLRRELLVARRLDPRQGFERSEARVEVRWDPLTGQTARLVESGRLMPPGCGAGGELARRTRGDCPFCLERLEAATPKLAPEISREGRLRRGEAVLFPNLLAYAKHSSVSVYSPRRHLLPLADLTARLVADNLATQSRSRRP